MVRRRAERRQVARGSFVVLVGPDGVGKTTVARELIRLRGGCSGYVHFRPSLWSPLDREPSISSTALKASPGGGRLLGILRIGKSLVGFWAGYLARIRPALRRGCVVVGDRWAYGYLLQPSSLGFHGPKGLARLVVSAMPRPDVVVVLQAPVDVIMARKQELGAEQIRAEMARAAALSEHRRITIDATQSPGEIARTILAFLDQPLS